jgi:uncharacterized DUF497 family protein
MRVHIQAFEFDWDAGNSGKNKKHGVEDSECEEVFFDQSKVTLKDKVHSAKEDRFIVLGSTKRSRLIYLVFTLRNHRIRIISARDINKKEVHLYEKAH